MKKYILYFYCFSVVFLTACYDDKGNYDYKDIDEIKISFDGDGYYSKTFGEVLEL